MYNPEAKRRGHVPSSEILAIAVKPEYQGYGIGTELLNHIERIASQLGMERPLLHTAIENEIAVMFFHDASFTVIGKEEGCYSRGQAAFSMAKKIGAGHKVKGSFTS